MQWIPFGVLPASAVQRLLSCSVLVVTSPSFSMNDSKRLCRIARQRCERFNSKEYPEQWGGQGGRLWDNVRSLVVYGTRMGPSGLLGLVQVSESETSAQTRPQSLFTLHSLLFTHPS